MAVSDPMRLLPASFCLVALLAACEKGPTPGAAPAPTPTSTPTEAKVVEPTPTAAAPAAALPTPVGTTFGAAPTVAEVTPIDKLLADPDAFKGKTVRVEGLVTDVCPKRGCWMELAGAQPGQKLKFKVTDGVMVFPPEAKGKLAVAQGEVTVRELSLEESKEYAAYQAKEYGKDVDPAKITAPMKVVTLAGTGAVLRDAK